MRRAVDRGKGRQPDDGSEDHSLELVYRSHAPALRRRLRAQMGSAEDANDLVHEAFTRLAGVRSSSPLRSPGAYLNRVVRNLLVDRARRLSVRPVHMPLDDGLAVAIRADQSDRLELEQMREMYRKAVESLPPRMREVFMLHRIEGLSYRDIANMLDISIRTVEWHIAQAIVRIARQLDGE